MPNIYSGKLLARVAAIAQSDLTIIHMRRVIRIKVLKAA